MLVAVGLAAAACVFAAGASADRTDEQLAPWSSQTVVIGYASDADLGRALRGRPVRIVERVRSLRTVSVRPRGDAGAFAAAVGRAKGIEFVHTPVARRPLVEPGLAPAAVPGGSYQWQFTATGADRVPQQVLRAAGVVRIAVVDSGADLSAPDLEAKRPLTYNAIDNSRDVSDPVGHGTFVASLAAGSATNGEGIAGVGGEARLTTIKASAEGLFTDFETASAIAYAVDNGAKIVNLSLGGSRPSPVEQRAIAYAVAKDVLLVAAAGNSFLEGNPVSYPAASLQPVGSNGVGGLGLAVGASTMSGGRAPFSSTGSYLSLAAPGLDVFGAVSKDSSPKEWPRVALPGSSKGLYGYSSGTSFSAPQVAGAAALVWTANPQLSSRQVADILKATASGRGAWNPELGFGVIDVAAAVERAKVTPAVSLLGYKYLTEARLRWRGSTRTERSYRLLVQRNGGPEEVLADTPATSYDFKGQSGVTYTFIVESRDAAGAAIARSAPSVLTLGEARSTLALRMFRVTVKKKRFTLLLAQIGTSAPDVKLGRRSIRVELRMGSQWRLVGYQMSDGGGRAVWELPRGRYTVRATLGKSADLAPAVSRPLTIRN
jgi:hypothetical protein